MKKTFAAIMFSVFLVQVAGQSSFPDHIVFREEFCIGISLNSKLLSGNDLKDAQNKYLKGSLKAVLASPLWSARLTHETYDDVAYTGDTNDNDSIVIRWIRYRDSSFQPDMIKSVAKGKESFRFIAKSALKEIKGLRFDPDLKYVDPDKLATALSSLTGLDFKIKGTPVRESDRVITIGNNTIIVKKLGASKKENFTLVNYDTSVYNHLKKILGNDPSVLRRLSSGKYEIAIPMWDSKKLSEKTIQKVLNGALTSLGTDTQTFPLKSIAVTTSGTKKIVSIDYAPSFVKTTPTYSTEDISVFDGVLKYGGKVITISLPMMKEFHYEIAYGTNL